MNKKTILLFVFVLTVAFISMSGAAAVKKPDLVISSFGSPTGFKDNTALVPNTVKNIGKRKASGFYVYFY
ncbi:MAG: hypothetical protein Q8M06_11075, partial [Methanobacteriaceae archaeon]|nr:hypothetical protein [Methanobacteriaceae archaeon]